MPDSNIQVINLQDKKEPFSQRKVKESAQRAGATAQTAEEIANTIADEVTDGMHTSEIYNRIKTILSEKEPQSAIKYSLKKAMRKLGPTGFPFEKFTAAILEKAGYDVKINKFLPGSCLDEYEIDFVARKEGTTYIGECKYHSDPGQKLDLQTALYNWARFEDILKGGKVDHSRLQSFLVTNSKFSNNASGYSKCKNVKLLGWRYPHTQGLEKVIEENNLYPVTILPSLKGKTKSKFSQAHIMLAKDLLEKDKNQLLKKLDIPENKLDNLIKEADTLLA